MMALQNTTSSFRKNGSGTTTPTEKIRTPPTKTLSSDSEMDQTLGECLYGEKPLRLRMKPSHVRRFDEDPAGYSSTDDEPDTTTPDELHPVVRSTSSESLLEDLAPVNKNWSKLANATPHRIDLVHLRKIVSAGGIVDTDEDSGASHRAVTWRVLLGYLPADTGQWKSTVLQQRQLYLRMASTLFSDTADVAEQAHELRGVRRRRVARGSPSFKGYSAKDRKVIPKCLKSFWTAKSLDSSVLERLTKGMNALRINFTDQEFEDDNGGEEKADSAATSNSSGGDTSAPESTGSATETSTSPNEEERGTGDDEKESAETPEGDANGTSPTPAPTELGGEEPKDPDHETATPSEAATTTAQAEEATTSTTQLPMPNSVKDEKLKDFVESAVLLDEIRKDVVRTHPDLAFFLEPAQNLGRRRYAALERILFIWSKYNRGVKYVQGMNEIAGILYFALANDQNQEWSEWAEADTYWLFHSLLTEMSDVFIAGLDDHDTGIQGRICAMQALLARHDPEVREHLDEIGIETSFYAIRWWTTMLSREFLLPDTIRLWDSMFSSTHKDNFLRFICVTMVTKIRTHLLKSDFSACLKTLHSYPSTNMDDLLEASRALYLYESQISLACQRGGLSLHQAMNTIESPPALIMAFGFPKGTPPVSRAEQFEKARQAVATNLGGVLGRASRLWNSPVKSKDAQTQETSNALALGRQSDNDDNEGSGEDVYMTAILDGSK